MAPETTAPRHRGRENPVAWLIPTAMGERATMVPTDVPMEMEIKHPIRNTPTTANFGGIRESPR